MELTSLDLSILMDEFSELEDGHVQKVYQRGQEFTIEIYVPGEEKKRLILGPDRAFISKYKRDNPERPPGFCMELRKHLGKIDSIKQRGFDRILEIKSGDHTLICEMFGKGNFILLDGEKIIGALRQEEWADRTIRTGREYVYPEPTTDPRDTDNYFELMDEGEIVREIASKLSFGGTYAEEVLARANIEKDRKIDELTDKEKEVIEDKLSEMIEPEVLPKLYLEDELPVRSAPFRLEKYADCSERDLETFSEAIDEYYYIREKTEEKRKKKEAYEEKLGTLERKKEQQERKIEGLKVSAEEKRENAEKIYENYQVLSQLKEQIESSIEEDGWDETQEKLKESDSEASKKINTLNEQDGFISVDLDGENLKIDLFQDLEATASQYYDKAKESEQKIESAEKALKETEKELESLEQESIDVDDVMEDKSEKRSKKWYEKYRWFHSSEGFMVLVGRDAQTNDMLVKKHMEDDDKYFHADFDGAPSVVVKDGQEAGEQTFKEAAQASVTFSKTWKAGIGADTVYRVDPEQVTQEPESGEYLSKGAFVIRGDRNYMRNVSVEAWIGPYEIEEDVFVPVVGPKDAVKDNCEDFIELIPGRRKKSDVAKSIQSHFDDYNLDLDYIIRALPPGESDISN